MQREIMCLTAGIHELHIKEEQIARSLVYPFPKDKLIARGLKCFSNSLGFCLCGMIMLAFYKG